MSRIGITEAAGSVVHQNTQNMECTSEATHLKRFRLGSRQSVKWDARKRTDVSFNVIIGPIICELNSRTKEARPEDFMPDPVSVPVLHEASKKGTFDVARDVSNSKPCVQAWSSILAGFSSPGGTNSHASGCFLGWETLPHTISCQIPWNSNNKPSFPRPQPKISSPE